MVAAETRSPPRRRKARFVSTLALAAGLLSVPLTHAVGVETPRLLPPGDPDRRAVLDELRPALTLSMRGPVEFRVSFVKTLRGWAHARVTPQRPGGAPIDIAETIWADDAAMMDGLLTEALFRRRGDRWHLVVHVVGPTDAAASNWTTGDCPYELLIGPATEETAR